MAAMTVAGDAGIRIVPANQASWDDVQAVTGPARCYESRCYCQRFKIPTAQWRRVTDEERAYRLRAQADCGHPEPGPTSGLVAYVEGEPAGWCAVEPRTAYVKLLTSRIPWAGRNEDKHDDGVWAITCMVVRLPYRRQGLTYVLTRAAVDYARQHGARAVEGYSMITHPGQEITWGELHVGSRNAFAAAGFRAVSSPTKRRVVMRIDLRP